MHILLDPGTYDCRNMGDVAMLQVAVARVRELWPDATIHVLTEDPVALAKYCPDVQPADNYGRRAWLVDRVPLGPLRRAIPAKAQRQLAHGAREAQARWPAAFKTALIGWKRIRGSDSRTVRAFLRDIHEADLLLVCGQGTLADAAREHAMLILSTARMALADRRPVALVGQGIGPIHDQELRALARRVLPSVGFIGVRERRVGPPLLQSLGVPADRVLATGDEAIEPAYNARGTETGNGIGVHVRLAPLAAGSAHVLERIRPVLHEYAARHGAPLLPLPIARHERGTDDVRAISQLLNGVDGNGANGASDGGRELDTPAKLIAQISRCRIVVSGAYHAAVFALSQGIPVICLARSEYYIDKFRGLADLFGPGCDIVHLDDPALAKHLVVAMDNAWAMADSFREPLREAAANQIALGRQGYERVKALTNGAR